MNNASGKSGRSIFLSCFRAKVKSDCDIKGSHQQKGSISLVHQSYCSKTLWNVSNTILHFGKDLLSGLTRWKGWNGHLQDVRCPLHPASLQVPELSHSDQPPAGLELRPVKGKEGGEKGWWWWVFWREKEALENLWSVFSTSWNEMKLVSPSPQIMWNQCYS